MESKGVIINSSHGFFFFFPDQRMFIETVGTLMRGEGTDQFAVQEIYRLKNVCC